MKRPVSLFASFFLWCSLSHAQVAPVPAPPAESVVAPQAAAAPSEATVKSDFDKLEAARVATATNSQERAEAASKAAETAAQVAWIAFDAGRFDEATTWFARQATLRRESYTAWKTTINGQIGNIQKTRATRLAAAKTESERAMWLEMTGTMQHIVLTQLQMQARQNNDSATLLDTGQRKLVIARELLELARKAPETDKNKAQNIAAKTLDVVAALDDIANALRDKAQWTEAEKTYLEAQALRQQLPVGTPKRDLAESLRELAVLRNHQGDFNGARQFYEQALAMRVKEEPERRAIIEASSPENKPLAIASDAISEVMMLNNLGLIADNSGDYKTSQSFYDRALARIEAMPQEGLAGMFRLQLRSITQANVAALHASQGLLEQARVEMEAAIQLQRSVGDQGSASVGLSNLGSLLYEKGDLEKARRYFEQARQLAVTGQDLPKTVSFTLSLASLLKQMDRLPEAVRYAEEGVVLANQADNWSLKGEAMRTLAGIRLSQNQPDAAQKLLEEAALTDQRVGAPLSTASTLEMQGRVREAKGDLAGAVTFYKQAVTLTEGVRATSVSESDFAGVKSNSKVYERLVQALIKLNRGEEAFDYLNRSRSKQLQTAMRVDSLKSDNPALQVLFTRAGGLDVRTRAMEGELQAEQAKPDAQRDPAKVRTLQTLVASTRGEWRKAVEAIKAVNPSYDKLFTVKPMALSETQPSIPTDAAFVMYVPLKTSETGDEQLTIFVVTRESLKIFTPGVKAADLWKRVRAVRRQIAAREDDFFTRGIKGNALTNVIGRGGPKPATRAIKGNALTNVIGRGPERAADAGVAGGDQPPGQVAVAGEPSLSDNLVALNEMLIAPIEAEVATKKLLAFIPTELLYYLPMQALAKRQGNDLRFLIEDKEVVYLSNADVMRVVQSQRTDKAAGGMVAFGDPVGANLPNAEQEVRTIAQIYPGSMELDGAQVTKAAVTAPGNLSRRVVHFATHGVLDPNVPSRSYILLSPGKSAGDEQLTVGEVWELPLQKVDLVTLSACNTALGERNPNGSELTTLAEAFSSAGASTVMASLWSVADESTRELMVEFYRQLAAGKTKSAALRAAELHMLKNPKYQHPYFWAPFILMGDWR